MRILVDLLGAPAKSGGMRLYAEQLVNAWQESFPDDELVLVGEPWLRSSFTTTPTLKIVCLPAKQTLSRLVGKLLLVPLVYAGSRFNAALSVSPVISPLIPKTKRFVVVHDWRHLKNPDEFGLARRVYRRLWIYSCQSAATTINISPKTQRETEIFAAKSKSAMVSNGYDHARHWVLSKRTLPSTEYSVVTFGHHTNKRPELAIAALSHLKGTLERPLKLSILGAEGENQQRLVALAIQLGVIDLCHFEGFASSARYQLLISGADVVAMLSSDEGFGLPIAEAAYFKIPCVVTSDSGVADLHRTNTIEADPTPESVADAIRRSLLRQFPNKTLPSPTWAHTAQSIRRIIEDSSASCTTEVTN